MPLPPYAELPTMGAVKSIKDLDPVAYLAANPDLRAAKVEPSAHFANYGINENRRQFINVVKIAKLRRKKLSSVSFRSHTVKLAEEGPLNFLTQKIRDSFEIPEFPPVAANEYHPEIVDIIRSNPKKLFLDVGAGLRHTYYSNVVNAEIWSSASTDVVCVGEDLPFSDAQFDYVFCLAVLEHTKRPWLAVQEIIRVTRPGGIIRVDWPFLQPVHGYPHHFFNATPKGNMSQFADHCDILSCEVRSWQHPIFALSWMLEEWRAGLPEAEKANFNQIKVGDILSATMDQQLKMPYCANLSPKAQRIIAAGTTLIAQKR
jgi:SAM-dependent methyltransferase